MIIYDAENQILGRLCSRIAKDLLNGEKVFVVNCEKAVVSGNPKYIVKKYLEKIWRGDVKHGPFFPKTPDGIFRRTVRGMLPWKKAKGRKAYKNLKVFVGLPEEFRNKEFKKIEEADASKLKTKFLTLEQISLAIGAKKRW
ncbi:MAG: 50S ribosomal protein L13 [Candidatus Aenigmatarchaeota archaeon]